ncbi:MAG: sn-glycerol-3-phosphate ABC transporter ATP-binding protein UgpC [Deltaproteobacteria bacterium]|nr:sn-glycerol-3-phosphate ABC transporter ATP-binding protein UgpC [Deltaproteobacteria bacterium]
MATVRFQNLRKSYGDTHVLTGIDLVMEEGEYVVLVGPSGCGKSTMLRCIAGLEDISSGDLFIGDRRVNDVAPKDRNVAMVFQSYALYPHMTVRENMAFALKVAKRSAEEIRVAVDEAARMLDLGHLLDRRPSQLSGGQRQRVAMGRAIVRRPDVFLFDEPLSNLDASLRTHMRVELMTLHKQLGTTMVHVTHDQVEALTLADRLVVLNKGVIQQVGSPRELFDRPINTFVATFIGSPSMNLLPATGHGATSTVDGVEGTLDVPSDGAFTLGIRPTDFTVGEGPLEADLIVVESLGSEAMLHMDLGEHRIVARVDEPQSFQSGDKVRLRPNKVHRFSAATGERLP